MIEKTLYFAMILDTHETGSDTYLLFRRERDGDPRRRHGRVVRKPVRTGTGTAASVAAMVLVQQVAAEKTPCVRALLDAFFPIARRSGE